MKRFGKDKITQKKLIPNTLPSPDIRALLLQLPGCHAFCKKDCKKHAPALRFRKKALRSEPYHVMAANRPAGVPARRTSRLSPAPPRKGKAPSIPLRRRLHAASSNLPAPLSRCLPGKKSKRPASLNEDTLSKKVGPQRFVVGLPVFVSAQSPCLQKSSKAGVPPLLPEVNRYADKKPSPVGRAEDMPVCLFAQGPFASAEYLVQLTSSLAQKVCLARGSPCPPGEWLKSHIAQPAEKGASS